MGLFYSNLTVFQPSREALVKSLKALNRTAFLSPTIQGHTVVFDKAIEGQNAEVIEDFGTSLTGRLTCAALASMLHDDDVLYFWLFQNGEVCDRYDSLPQYFDPNAEPGPPEGGDSELLCLAFGRPDRKERVETLLRATVSRANCQRGGESLSGIRHLPPNLDCRRSLPAFVIPQSHVTISQRTSFRKNLRALHSMQFNVWKDQPPNQSAVGWQIQNGRDCRQDWTHSSRLSAACPTQPLRRRQSHERA